MGSRYELASAAAAHLRQELHGKDWVSSVGVGYEGCDVCIFVYVMRRDASLFDLTSTGFRGVRVFVRDAGLVNARKTS